MVPTSTVISLPLFPVHNNKQLQMPSKVTQKFRSWSSILQIACQSGELELLLSRSCSCSSFLPCLAIISQPGYIISLFSSFPFQRYCCSRRPSALLLIQVPIQADAQKFSLTGLRKQPPRGMVREGSDRADQAGILLPDNGWDGQFKVVVVVVARVLIVERKIANLISFQLLLELPFPGSRQQAGQQLPVVGSSVFFNCSSKCTQMPNIKISAQFECIIPAVVAGPLSPVGQLSSSKTAMNHIKS